MKVWLLVDCNYMCWRAFHSTGGLTHGGVPTGVSFGLLRDLEMLINLHGASRCILAFDGGASKRVEISQTYKSSRRNHEYTEEEKEQRQAFYDEMERLRSNILPEAGFRNILRERGYEADDIVAKIAGEIPENVEAVIISSDGDLLQCLDERVSLYNPTAKKMTTDKAFRQKWGIDPCLWANVKALAGCSTDDVEGIHGIGEVSAAKWFAGTLKPESAAFKKISQNLHVFEKNIGLVQLPFPGLRIPNLIDDEVTLASLAKVKANLGIRNRSILKRTEAAFDL